jgi:hypothetical protein
MFDVGLGRMLHLQSIPILGGGKVYLHKRAKHERVALKFN